MTSTARIPHTQTTRYKIGAMLYKRGPLPRAEIYNYVAGSSAESNCRILTRAINDRWLTETRGMIYLGAVALLHFGGDPEESASKFVGQAATSRASSAYDRPPLSRKYLTNSRGTRDDVPAFSVRQSQSSRSVPTGRV